MQGVELAVAQPRGKAICQGPAFLKEEERKTTIIISFPPPHNQQIGAEAETGREVICWGRKVLYGGEGGGGEIRPPQSDGVNSVGLMCGCSLLLGKRWCCKGRE